MFQWVGLGLAILGGLMAVLAFPSNMTVVALGVVFFVLGLFVLSRPNL